ncbi:MAG: 16S rRNA (uracil(1498)-N(3))-methyltransferase [Chitinophagales bacterium]|nr:16S rRNA (uracil(1498)-N(3))-methyltransferase [Chitinophagales bacterium]MCZ2394742.1 16S rRNA (uracil(1498)-N(3))-methyltransferase [Chitinophagales bacterium]
MIKRFFATDKIADSFILSEEELHHSLNVLRVKNREHVEIFDGKGNLWIAEVEITGKKSANFIQIETVISDASHDSNCSLAVALTKNSDRIEWLLEKIVEIGINEFYPIITHRTERKFIRKDRLEKILLSATKQSQRLWLPVLHDPISFENFIQIKKEERKFIAHCNQQDKKSFSDIYHKGEKAIILIGPEGDFTEQEISLALKNNYEAIALGEARLRVETAALAACVWVNLS